MNNSTFSEFSNHLYFDIWTLEPHSLIRDFVEIEIPYLKNQGKTKWTAYPKELEQTPEYDFVNKEVRVNKHPYFAGNYLNCILAFNLRKIESVTVGIVSVSLLFEYDSNSKCLHDFEKLSDIFRSVKSNEELVAGNKKHIVFSNPDSHVWPFQIQVKITKPISNEHIYNLNFIQGGIED